MTAKRWLQFVGWGTVLFGLGMVLAPALTRTGAAALIFGDGARMEAWPAEARWYATLAHGVIGAVMVGWAVGLLALLRGPQTTVPRPTWWGVTAALLTWYVPDSAFSLAMGAWQNAAMNTLFLALFVPGLWAAWRAYPRPA